MKNNTQPQKFTIIIRLRPTLLQDHNIYSPTQLQKVLHTNHNTITINRKNNQQKHFKFTHVLHPGTQQQLYSSSKHLVQSIFLGHNATFLAYGQTGTGKTHSVFGADLDQGYFGKAIDNIFNQITNRKHQRQFSVRVNFVQFYLDAIHDLLQPPSRQPRKLQIKQDPDYGIHIRDLTQLAVKSSTELHGGLRNAIKTRRTQQTSANKRSSRSHAVIQITLLQRWKLQDEIKYSKAMLKIVDLAGSQRVSKTQSFGNRLQEAKRINKEITTLGKCINMLAQAEKQGKILSSDSKSKLLFNKIHVPFRDSKVTRFLSEALQGRAKIVLCVCVSTFATHIQQSFSSLMFATQASTLKIDSRRNQVYTLNKSIDKIITLHPPRNNSKQDIDRYVKQLNQSPRTKIVANQMQGNKLVEKFKREIVQINHYMQTKQIILQEQSKEILEQNLIAMNRIFNVLRREDRDN